MKRYFWLCWDYKSEALNHPSACTLLVNHTSNLSVIFLDRISLYFRLGLNLGSGDPLSASQVVRTTVEYHLAQLFFFLRMTSLFLIMCLSANECRCPQRLEASDLPGAKVTGSLWAAWCGCCEQNTGVLEEYEVPLITESPSPLFSLLCNQGKSFSWWNFILCMVVTQ